MLLVGAILPLSDAIDGEREASEAGGEARVDMSGSGSQGGERGEEQGGGVRAPRRSCEAAHRCTRALRSQPSSGIANANGVGLGSVAQRSNLLRLSKLQSLHSGVGQVAEQYRLGIDCEVDVGEDSPGLIVESTYVVAAAMMETFNTAPAPTGIPAISSHSDSASAFYFFLPAHRLAAAAFAFCCQWSSLR
jgi:hypothetical protein